MLLIEHFLISRFQVIDTSLLISAHFWFKEGKIDTAGILSRVFNLLCVHMSELRCDYCIVIIWCGIYFLSQKFMFRFALDNLRFFKEIFVGKTVSNEHSSTHYFSLSEVDTSN